MKYSMKIGWQKYEDMLEKQMSSPILTKIIKNLMLQHSIEENEEEDDDENDDFDTNEIDNKHVASMMIPMSKEIIDEISISSNFDCWVGHTNFDITPAIKEKLNKIPGIEVLKVFSRYRFFIGIGYMFDFADVRKIIEQNLILPKGETNV